MENYTFITLSCFTESEAWDYYNDETVTCYSHIFNIGQGPEDQRSQRVINIGEIIGNLVGKYCDTYCATIKS